jgi:hypothetical protein
MNMEPQWLNLGKNPAPASILSAATALIQSPAPDDDGDNMICPHCHEIVNLHDCDSIGAYDACVFCANCTMEFQT